MESDENGPFGLEVKRFISWLGYCYCEVAINFPNQVFSIRNTENGICTSVPANYGIIERGMMYWVCKELMVDMPPGFEKYQKMWDDAEPEQFDI
ncbi:MAG: hypothetical protein ACRYFZ_11990 [Janthinobacterium lividum]